MGTTKRDVNITLSATTEDQIKLLSDVLKQTEALGLELVKVDSWPHFDPGATDGTVEIA